MNQSDTVGADMISVAIVDDHPVYRQGLAMVVDNAEDLELIGEAKSIEDFDKLQSPVDVVLLDLHLPGIDGSAGVAHVCAAGYRALVVSAAGTPEDVIDAIAAGAVGYLTKETDADEITRAIRTVAAGDTYVSPTLRRTCSGPRSRPRSTSSPNVSATCWHFWRPGRRDQEIAAQLCIATTTGHSHLERIRDNTGARRRAQLTTLAHRLGIGPSESDNRR